MSHVSSQSIGVVKIYHVSSQSIDLVKIDHVSQLVQSNCPI